MSNGSVIIFKVGFWIWTTAKLRWKCKVKVLTQSCLILCKPMDCSLTCFFVRGILQAKILEWAVFPFSRGSSWPRDWTQVCIAVRFFTVWAPRKPRVEMDIIKTLCRGEFREWMYRLFIPSSYSMSYYVSKGCFSLSGKRSGALCTGI